MSGLEFQKALLRERDDKGQPTSGYMMPVGLVLCLTSPDFLAWGPYVELVPGYDGSLKNIELIRKITYRLKKLLRILNESSEYAHRQCLPGSRHSRDRFVTEKENDDRDANRTDEIHKRIKYRVVVDGFDVRITVVVVDLVKASLRFSFGIH